MNLKPDIEKFPTPSKLQVGQVWFIKGSVPFTDIIVKVQIAELYDKVVGFKEFSVPYRAGVHYFQINDVKFVEQAK